MKSPFKRKKTKRKCPIHIESLYRHWDRGDNRIDWSRIEKLYDAWRKGEKVPWRKLSHTFVKKLKRRDRNPATEHFAYTPPERARRANRNQNIFYADIDNWYETAVAPAFPAPEFPLDLVYTPRGPVQRR